MRVLITGGAGYIGSHTCVLLLKAGHSVTVIDNLSNSSSIALQRAQELAGKPLRFVEGDIRNPNDLASASESTGICPDTYSEGHILDCKSRATLGIASRHAGISCSLK